MLTPAKLKAGDEVRVLALSRTLGAAVQQAGFTEEDVAFACRRLESMGLRVSFGRHVWECNEHLTASPAHRLADLREAVTSASVKAILAVSGGMGATQIADGINYEQLKAQPKIICGYSDIAHVCNAVLGRVGVVIGNCDFGHTTPMLTLPLGGRCKLQVSEGKSRITVTEH